MAYKTADIFQNNNFLPFCASIKDVVLGAVEKYWEQDVKIKIRAMNDFRELREEEILSGVDFFSSQIKVENHKPITIRLDSDFIENFFEIALNDNLEPVKNSNFKLSSLSPLEVKILNNFCEFLYKRIKEILIPVNDAKLSEKSERMINILFYIRSKNSLTSNIMVSIPQDRIKLNELEKTLSFKDEDFLNQYSYVGIKMGNSKITLSELKNLESGDIILLEDSNIKTATLLSGNFKKKFNVKPDKSRVLSIENNIEIENTNEQINNEVTMEKNLWDDIQVEISAEFAKVKMSIGELKQITQGQIVDLGSVFDNEISLFVENKKVAKGELVIINDKYAVRLDEIMSSNVKPAAAKPQTVPQNPQAKPQAQTAKPAAAKPQAKPQAQNPQPKPNPAPPPKPQKPQQQEEEFDYSDFEK